jgi:hypothetical protein
VEFNAKEALKIARSLSFPRAVGSAGEATAASLIEKKLLDSGYHPQREEFFISWNPWTIMKGFVFLAILILLGARGLATYSPMTSGILILLMVIFLAFYSSFWLKFVGTESILKQLSRRKKEDRCPCSQNIVACLAPVEKAEQYLYLVAHYDSKSQSLPILLRSFFLLLSGLTSLWLGFSYLWPSKEVLGSFPSWPIDFGLTLSFLGMIPILLLKTANRSPGGLDNAGSLGILLHLAEVLKQKRPLHSQVIFLFPSAEELGLQGAFSYLQKHKEEIEKEKSYFLNLDAVGIKGATRIFFRKGSLPVGRKSLFVSRLKEIAEPFAIGTASFSFGVMMDHQAFLEKGYPAVSLACASRKFLKVHTAKDTADLLEVEGMEEVGKFVLAWVRSWEKE